MNNEPVAWRTHYPSGWEYKDGNPPFELKGNSQLLYTHPIKELNDGGEPVKNATYWKRQYNLMASQNDNLKSGLYHANEQIKYLESHPVKEHFEDEPQAEELHEILQSNIELTDEKIWEVIDNYFGVHAFNLDYQISLDEAREDAFELVKAVLRKAQEK